MHRFSSLTTVVLTLVVVLTLSSASLAIDTPLTAGNPPDIGIEAFILVLYVLLALVFSFLCSIAEAVLLSVTPTFIEDQKDKRPKRAALLQRLKIDNVDRSLAAILTLNTIAHTVGAIGAGAQAKVVLGNTWFAMFSAVMTLMILFLSEIVPKTIGAVYWSALAGPTAVFVRSLIVILYPIVWVSEFLTRFISRGKEIHLFTKDEFIAMARIGEQKGILEDKESRVIRNLFRFGSLNVSDIMTPRTVVASLPENMPVKDAMERLSQCPFSRVPVYKNDIDDISGFILKNDALLQGATGDPEGPLSGLKRQVIAVPKTATLSTLFERFIEERQHVAIAFDEHGGVAGLVTLEDLLETLMGIEIVDEADRVEDMRALARKLWTRRAKKLGIEDIDQ